MKQFKPYPLKFKPIAKEKIWGGNRIEKLYHKGFSENLAIGESWELCDHFDDISIISNGIYQGMNLNSLITEYPVEIMGKTLDEGEKFPIIVKILDPNDKLSIQVHPHEEYIKSHPNVEAAKTEIWYVTRSDPEAEIILGNKPGVTKQQIYQELKKGNGLDRMLNHLKVKQYQVYPIFAGTIHALLPGSIIFEIQQNSDVTFRLYDWDRSGADGKPRELHIDQALDVINLNPRLVFPEQILSGNSKLVFKSHLFEIIEYHLQKESVNLSAEAYQILTVVEGRGVLGFKEGINDIKTDFSAGDTLLIPASIKNYILDAKIDARILLTQSV